MNLNKYVLEAADRVDEVKAVVDSLSVIFYNVLDDVADSLRNFADDPKAPPVSPEYTTRQTQDAFKEALRKHGL